MLHHSIRLAATSLIFACAAASQAEIVYNVKVNPTDKRLEISIAVPADADTTTIQMPSWMPGAYTYGNFFQNVHDVTANGPDGKDLTVTHPDPNTWTTSGASGTVTFKYWIQTGGVRRFGMTNDDSFVQIAGPATYMYVVGRKTEKCKIHFDVPSGWPILLGLDSQNGDPATFTAPTYDVLADAPVSTGDVLVDQYKLRGIDHYIVLEGKNKGDVDRARLLKDCRFVSAAETDFFGGAPYKKYVWHFIVYPAADGAGGLEHLSSTQISLSSGEGPRAQSVLAHEFFHLWNVKRTRAKVLGPFDYLHLPRTGALWWLEGVTDYYATVLPYRYQEWTEAGLFDGIVRNYNLVESNPAHLQVSPNDASLKVADAEGGRGNSNGFQISYYNLGWLCGLCLDTEIRYQTHGKHSLDDVTRALFDKCKNNKPGFEEDEIRKQCIRFGGPSLGPFYDQVVNNPGELPIKDQLAKIGLLLKESDEDYVDAGFTATSGFGGGVRAAAIHGPARGLLIQGDSITAIDGQSVGGLSRSDLTKLIHDHIEAATLGTPIALTLTRDGKEVRLAIDPVSATRKVRSISEDPNASPETVALRTGYLATKKPSVE